uniref:Variant surface glycoprotein 1125.1180 n=1 Tax=Trypanosoma brucei TaxID=5691 RepID=A0A1J0R4I0_9TRYP|nr:variant surface glycoprotein 1125.1180 [Trypanosoma brucei]
MLPSTAAFTAAILLTAQALRVEAAFQADAAADLQLLCSFIALEAAEPHKVALPGELEQEIQEVRTMNMSTADPEWQAIFERKDGQDTWEKAKGDTKSEPYRCHWEDTYDKWVADRAQAQVMKGNKKWIEKNPPPSTESGRQAAHELINSSLTEIQRLKLEYDEQKKAAEAHAATAKTKIMEMLYGQEKASATPVTAKTLKATSSYGEGCGINGGYSVYGDALCICGESASDSAQECDNSNLDITWQTDIKTTQLSIIKGKCPTKPGATYTGESLQTVRTALAPRLRHTARGGNTLVTYLGTSSDGTCDGADGKTCVIYDDAFKPGDATTGISSIKWVAKLDEAIQELKNAELKAIQAAATGQKIETLIHTAKEVYTAKRYNIQTPQKANPSEAPASTTQKITDADCNNHKTNSTCQSPCTWHESETDKDKKCKLDPKNSRTTNNPSRKRRRSCRSSKTRSKLL